MIFLVHSLIFQGNVTYKETDSSGKFLKQAFYYTAWDIKTKVGILVCHFLSFLAALQQYLGFGPMVVAIGFFFRSLLFCWTFPLNPRGSLCFPVIANLAILNRSDLGNATTVLCPAIQRAVSLSFHFPFLKWQA